MLSAGLALITTVAFAQVTPSDGLTAHTRHVLANTTKARTLCYGRVWYADPDGAWRLAASTNEGGKEIRDGLSTRALGVVGGDGVIYWILDRCRNAPGERNCDVWPGLYAKPADPVAAALWSTYYDDPRAPRKLLAYHDGDPAKYHGPPTATQHYDLHILAEMPAGQREGFERAYFCGSVTPHSTPPTTRKVTPGLVP